MLCGTAAAQRVKRLAEQALQHSDAVGTLETGRVHRALRKIIVERFFKQQLPIDVPHVEKAMSAAMKVAKRDRADTAHFFSTPADVRRRSGYLCDRIGDVYDGDQLQSADGRQV